MTALVDDTFRVLAAARQGDPDRVRALLAGMTTDEVTALAQLLAGLRVPVAAECLTRACQLAGDLP